MIKFILIFVTGLFLLSLIPAEYVPDFLTGLHSEANKLATPIKDNLINSVKRL